MFKKKWSREECRKRYVEGTDRIGVRALAKLSGRSHSTVGRWCAEDDWAEERERYQNELRTETRQKTIEKTSEAESDDLSKRNRQHLLGFEVFRKLSLEYPVAIKQGDEKKKKKLKDDALAFQKYAAVYRDCVMAERVALDMDMTKIDAAVKKVLEEGFEIIEPEQDQQEED